MKIHSLTKYSSLAIGHLSYLLFCSWNYFNNSAFRFETFQVPHKTTYANFDRYYIHIPKSYKLDYIRLSGLFFKSISLRFV